MEFFQVKISYGDNGMLVTAHGKVVETEVLVVGECIKVRDQDTLCILYSYAEVTNISES